MLSSAFPRFRLRVDGNVEWTPRREDDFVDADDFVDVKPTLSFDFSQKFSIFDTFDLALVLLSDEEDRNEYPQELTALRKDTDRTRKGFVCDSFAR